MATICAGVLPWPNTTSGSPSAARAWWSSVATGSPSCAASSRDSIAASSGSLPWRTARAGAGRRSSPSRLLRGERADSAEPSSARNGSSSSADGAARSEPARRAGTRSAVRGSTPPGTSASPSLRARAGSRRQRLEFVRALDLLVAHRRRAFGRPLTYHATCLRISCAAWRSADIEDRRRSAAQRAETLARRRRGRRRPRSRAARAARNTHGSPNAARPSMTASQPVVSSMRIASAAEVTSPLPMTGT